MKNNLSDLNDHLFAQIERLSDESITAEQLAIEIERGRAISGIAKDVINNAAVVLNAHKVAREYGSKAAAPAFLALEDKS